MSNVAGKCHLVTISFDKDLGWLKYCLSSCQKYCKGYSGHTVLIDDYEDTCKKTHEFLDSQQYASFSIVPYAKEIHQGYIRQQFMKLVADRFIPNDTDWVVYVDSDSVFFEENDPSIYFSEDNKPIMLKTDYEVFKIKKDPMPWQESTENFMKESVKYEFMRRMPLIYPIWMFDAIREFTIQTHGVKLLDYLANTKKIAEFNIMGAYLYKYHNKTYQWINTEKEKYKPLPLAQFWSHAKLEEHIPLMEALIHKPEVHQKFVQTLKNECQLNYRNEWQKDKFLKLLAGT